MSNGSRVAASPLANTWPAAKAVAVCASPRSLGGQASWLWSPRAKASPASERRLAVFIVCALAGLSAVFGSGLASGQTLEVTITGDSVDIAPGDGVCADALGNCSLRAAIIEANALAGMQQIHVPAGHFTLTLDGAMENIGLSGDLDIRDDVDIVGAGAELTRIDAQGIDRVFDIGPDGVLASATMQRLTVSGGSRLAPWADAEGGGIRVGYRGALTLSDAIVRDNRAAQAGGGIVSRGFLVVRRSRIEHNSALSEGTAFAEGLGGGVAVGGSETAFAWLSETMVLANQAHEGGGVCTIRGENPGINTRDGYGLVVVDQSAIIGNSAGIGGGYMCDTAGSTVIRNSTLSANSATSSGGGFYNDNECLMRVESSTVVGNSAPMGGGFQNLHGPNDAFLYIQASVLADNIGYTCHGSAQSGGHNLVHTTHPGGGSACPWPVAEGDLLDVPALLAELQMPDQGTAFHEPLPGSPLVDAAGTACPEVDQRGLNRPADGDGDGAADCDIGAIELGAGQGADRSGTEGAR